MLREGEEKMEREKRRKEGGKATAGHGMSIAHCWFFGGFRERLRLPAVGASAGMR